MRTMVPQQSMVDNNNISGNNNNNNGGGAIVFTINGGGRSESPSSSVGVPLFGSQLIDKNSATPYSDATQVSF